jgi:hypothetical protein
MCLDEEQNQNKLQQMKEKGVETTYLQKYYSIYEKIQAQNKHACTYYLNKATFLLSITSTNYLTIRLSLYLSNGTDCM